jgi:lysophospholipase L1-like esterase
MDWRRENINWKEVYDRGILREGNFSRMHRVMKKAGRGETIRIAFLGGSITAGAAATTPQTCYAYLVYSWWQKRFPDCKMEYINAGVGATNSKFGVARVGEDVLARQADVIFTEFAVNDSDEELFQETYEGLIRKILLDQKEPALFLTHNAFYHDGHNTQRIHSQIGNYYDLPMVSIKESLYEEICRGNFTNTEISADDLHPNDLGHAMIAGVITNLLDKIYTAVMVDGYRDPGFQVPEKAVTRNRYFSSERFHNTNTCPESKGFVKDETDRQNVWDVFRYGWSAFEAGSRISFEVNAEHGMIAVQYRKYAEHPAPRAIAVIDGEESQAVLLDGNFEETWGDCLYLQDIMIDGTAGMHMVEIVLTEPIENKEFYLASVITA